LLAAVAAADGIQMKMAEGVESLLAGHRLATGHSCKERLLTILIGWVEAAHKHRVARVDFLAIMAHSFQELARRELEVPLLLLALDLVAQVVEEGGMEAVQDVLIWTLTQMVQGVVALLIWGISLMQLGITLILLLQL
jgi:hypothetical protein